MPPVDARDDVVEAAAGTLGALLALVTTYPLITLNTRQHVTRRRERDGDDGDDAPSTSSLSSMYDGIEPALVGTACSQAVYNYWYSRANGTYRARRGRDATGAASLAIASFAGCVNVLMTLPIWTIVTKMQADVRRRENDRDDGEEAASVERDVDAETAAAKLRSATSEGGKKNGDQNGSGKKKRSFFDIAREVVRDGGVCGLWQGLTPSLVMVANPALQYAFYETVAKWRLKRDRKTTLSAPEIFVFGACAKFGATMSNLPLDGRQVSSPSRLQRHGGRPHALPRHGARRPTHGGRGRFGRLLQGHRNQAHTDHPSRRVDVHREGEARRERLRRASRPRLADLQCTVRCSITRKT